MIIAIEFYLQIDKDEWVEMQNSIKEFATKEEYANDLIDLLKDIATDDGMSFEAWEISDWHDTYVDGKFSSITDEYEHPELYKLMEFLSDNAGKH